MLNNHAVTKCYIWYNFMKIGSSLAVKSVSSNSFNYLNLDPRCLALASLLRVCLLPGNPAQFKDRPICCGSQERFFFFFDGTNTKHGAAARNGSR